MSEPEAILQAAAQPGEEPVDRALRPKTLDEFVGQEQLKKNLKVFLEAARRRSEPLDHCLFYSPPGLGKTTLANILARELGVNLRTSSGPIMERVGDLAAMLTDLSEGDVFFIDEIHRLNALVEEALYPVMEDYTFFISTGKGPAASTLKLAVPRFTLVGATTRAGLLTGPLRDRFGIVGNLGFYEPRELEAIVRRSANILAIPIDEEGSREIARRCRGTPRIANRLLRRVRDFAQVEGGGKVNGELARYALERLEIDPAGLDAADRRLLRVIIEKFDGGPVGLETLAIAVCEELDTLTDVVEPFLIQAGFILRTPRGRLAAPTAYAHLGLPQPRRAPELL
ncbi:MAG: Holliday junction branch migration DNA helicase RuvB [Elusimicrobia bacterium]|nr:Holliday junction branch migration DNA helicase RuvB [Elusimicrobiota bacterium]MDE2236623.1 Holliday junction branch migration DNA helicase RuvB [Elusimicrobiota bacterium]MDE2424865.1 Holliday junction branch migration DNA helicase RuvB [Elusimicrobiota bacterium]